MEAKGHGVKGYSRLSINCCSSSLVGDKRRSVGRVGQLALHSRGMLSNML